MTVQSFDDYLKEAHSEYYSGTDDDMPDAYEAWVEKLDTDELIKFADVYGKKLCLEGFDRAREIAMREISNLTNP